MLVVAALLTIVAGQNLQNLEKATQRNPTAANFRALADAYVRAEQYDRASATFYKASTLYGKLGDPNAAKVLQIQAERYETRIELYFERPPTRDNYTAAPLEPRAGCYIGAFIDREDGIDGYVMGNGQRHKDPRAFDIATGKKHASYFTYLGYGRPFPSQWVSLLKRNNAAAHIAWEPRSIGSVRDDDYLRRFARACAASDVPIFLRFAGEMNGEWTPYHNDPDGYRRMFRTVARVMHREAPNVAMVWCPNNMPENSIDNYYPGDDAVDWVGVNFYSVIYNDADRARGAEWRNPADFLRYVYNNYSVKHPMMIGEWAASRHSVVDNKPRPDFAINKIAQLYSALPRTYPRVKAVHWLSMNTIQYAMPGRQLNDYSLLGDPDVLAKYKAMIAPEYFLNFVDNNVTAPYEFARIAGGTTLRGKVKMSAVVKTYEQRPSVIWNINGEPSSAKTEPGAYEVSVDTGRLNAAQAIISLVVKDSKNRVAGRKEVIVKLGK